MIPQPLCATCLILKHSLIPRGPCILVTLKTPEQEHLKGHKGRRPAACTTEGDLATSSATTSSGKASCMQLVASPSGGWGTPTPSQAVISSPCAHSADNTRGRHVCVCVWVYKGGRYGKKVGVQQQVGVPGLSARDKLPMQRVTNYRPLLPVKT